MSSSLEDLEIKRIYLVITSCCRNVNNLKKIIEEMITDSSIWTTQANTVDKSLRYIDNNINTLENLFLDTDRLSSDKKGRKIIVVLIEETISDMREFRQKLEKIKTFTEDMKALSCYLEGTRL